MKRLFSLSIALLAVSIFAVGCEKPDTPSNGSSGSTTEENGHDQGHDDHEGHDHAAHDHSPKHGGILIELGRDHAYHAEFVDDHDTETVTVYISDSHMEALKIDQESISITMTAGDNTKTFELAASQSGGSDKFASDDAELMEMIETEGSQGKLRVTIDDKPYTGTFDHDAHHHDDHEGHGHDEDSHEGHDH